MPRTQGASNLTPTGAPYADQRTVRRQYGPGGQETAASLPDGDAATGTSVTTLYDRRGLPSGVGAAGQGGPLAMFTRNTAGNVVHADSSWHGDPRARHGFDVYFDRLGRVTQDTAWYATSGGASDTHVTSDQSFQYGATDELAELHTSLAGVSPRNAVFTYDDRHQLKSAGDDRGYVGTFDYDEAGQFLEAHVSAYDEAPDAHRRDVEYIYGGTDPEAVTELRDTATDAARATYTYDQAGNVTQRRECPDPSNCSQPKVYSFSYDGDLRQAKAVGTDGTTEIYYYDANGQRTLAIRKSPAGTYERARFWFGETEVHYDGTGAESKVWVHVSLGGLPIARIENRTTLEFTHHSRLGSLLVADDASGNIKGGFTYGPWGEILDAVGQPNEYTRRMNGKEADDLTGLSYYGFRYYDPLSLSWTQADPKYRFVPDAAWDDPRRANLYAFSLQDPIRFVDPDGLTIRLICDAGDKINCHPSPPPPKGPSPLSKAASAGGSLLGDMLVGAVEAVFGGNEAGEAAKPRQYSRRADTDLCRILRRAGCDQVCVKACGKIRGQNIGLCRCRGNWRRVGRRWRLAHRLWIQPRHAWTGDRTRQRLEGNCDAEGRPVPEARRANLETHQRRLVRRGKRRSRWIAHLRRRSRTSAGNFPVGTTVPR